MADYGEFGRALDHIDGAPDVFTFHGEPFILPARMSSLPLMRFAWRGKVIDQRVEQARSAMARATTDDERAEARAAEGAADMEALSAIYEFLQSALPDPQDWHRFEAIAIRVGADQDELIGVCNAVYGAVTGRPTRRPADSAGGPSTTGEPSTVASSSPDSVPGPQDTSAGTVAQMTPRDRAVAAFMEDMRPVGSLR